MTDTPRDKIHSDLQKCEICGSRVISYKVNSFSEDYVTKHREELTYACNREFERLVRFNSSSTDRFPDNLHSVLSVGGWKESRSCGNAQEVVLRMRKEVAGG